MDPDAIAKQKDLIARIHKASREEFMSTNVLIYTPAEEVFRIAKEHEARDADIAKIVTSMNTDFHTRIYDHRKRRTTHESHFSQSR